MQELAIHTTLQSGKYKIIEHLGQGGFGITYLAMQSGLERKVAVKEFFIKELCVRDESTSHVTLGTTDGTRETVARFREKFLKEARNIARLNHPNIVHIIDVFEENGTAYYVMEYAENGSLAEKVKQQGYLSEPMATRYILQVASALEYIHQQKMNHLDVKPANIMLNEKDESVLIDFVLSKQYDAITGNQTSTTPVGISEGYAPMEQYKQGGVGAFSPETDIYALGATFFKLLTGITPPSASDVNEDGVPVHELKAKGVSQKTIDVICKAMEGRKKDRMKDVRVFIDWLKNDKMSESIVEDDETTVLAAESQKKEDERRRKETEAKAAKEKAEAERKKREAEEAARKAEEKKRSSKTWMWIAAGVVAIIAVVVGISMISNAPTRGTSSYTPNVNTYYANGVSFQMVEVRGGTFRMGGTSEQGFDAWGVERPVHYVTLSSYYIGKTEVTQALWQAVMGSNPSRSMGSRKPVERVSWHDCQTFISKLNSITGKNFRMPTEAEWEFASRGGTKSQGYKYSGSNTLGNVAWYDDNSGSTTHEVGQKYPNELGLYDMSGNVCEWCSDWYGDYSRSSQTNPAGASTEVSRVNRGGSWINFARSSRVSDRSYNSPGRRGYNLGLRLVLSE